MLSVCICLIECWHLEKSDPNVDARHFRSITLCTVENLILSINTVCLACATRRRKGPPLAIAISGLLLTVSKKKNVDNPFSAKRARTKKHLVHGNSTKCRATLMPSCTGICLGRRCSSYLQLISLSSQQNTVLRARLLELNNTIILKINC